MIADPNSRPSGLETSVPNPEEQPSGGSPSMNPAVVPPSNPALSTSVPTDGNPDSESGNNPPDTPAAAT